VRSRRLFIAAELPTGVPERLNREVEPAAWPRHRLVRTEAMHVTFLFLGNRTERELPGLMEGVARATAGVGPGALTLERIATLPPGKGGRLVAAVGKADAVAVEVQRRLVRRLATDPQKESGREFLPHVTLARFAPGCHAEIDRRLAEGVGVPVGELVLFESVLRPDGAQHREVGRFPMR
jgi:RNA 2',3'-cyclic 3'-phosphodiesterase